MRNIFPHLFKCYNKLQESEEKLPKMSCKKKLLETEGRLCRGRDKSYNPIYFAFLFRFQLWAALVSLLYQLFGRAYSLGCFTFPVCAGVAAQGQWGRADRGCPSVGRWRCYKNGEETGNFGPNTLYREVKCPGGFLSGQHFSPPDLHRFSGHRLHVSLCMQSTADLGFVAAPSYEVNGKAQLKCSVR